MFGYLNSKRISSKADLVLEVSVIVIFELNKKLNAPRISREALGGVAMITKESLYFSIVSSSKLSINPLIVLLAKAFSIL